MRRHGLSRAILVAAALALRVPPMSTPALAATAASEITVTAKRLLEPSTGAVLRDVRLRIADGRVVAVEQGYTGAATHALGDVTLLPGLVDCHTHLIGGEELDPFQLLTQTPARAAIEGVANARATLSAGFTTVRDLGASDLADVALRDAIAAGRVPGPRMLVAVKAISSTGGHGDRNDLPPEISVARFSALADGPDAIRAQVRENVKRGADWIKVHATGGVTSAGTDPGRADYSEAELRAAVEAARDRGRDVAAHAHGTEGILRAARAGVRSIEHASMLDDAAIAAVRASGAFLVPNPITNAYMLERGAAGGYTVEQLTKSRDVYGRKLESLRRAIRAGLPIAYGTDSGVQPHGANGRQLAVYVEAGMTPLQALQSATVVAARLLRLEGSVGTLVPGAFADVVAVAGDPLADVRVVERPLWVMKGGAVVVSTSGETR